MLPLETETCSTLLLQRLMRLLFAIPHYFRHDKMVDADSPFRAKHASQTATPESRAATLRKTVVSLHQSFGASQGMLQIADRRTMSANQSLRHEVDVVVASVEKDHLFDQAEIPDGLITRRFFQGDPIHLGFCCHTVLREQFGRYDYYGYLEDDLSIADSWMFEKLRWFNSYVGDEKLLLPNRFERSENLAYKKCYVDGDLAERVTKPFQNVEVNPELQSMVMGKPVRFVRPLNPHSGCFFLNANQMARLIAEPSFGHPSSDFIGPLESAATLSAMKAFAIYKPAPENANFLEIEHDGNQFIQLIRMPGALQR